MRGALFVPYPLPAHHGAPHGAPLVPWCPNEKAPPERGLFGTGAPGLTRTFRVGDLHPRAVPSVRHVPCAPATS